MTTFSPTLLITGFKTTMPHCPCCSDSLLPHIRGGENYWFCRSCWQEMPVLTQRHAAEVPEPILAKLAKKIAPREHSLSSYHLSQPDSFQARLEGKWNRGIVHKV
jgi:ribosomal protein L37AE/L43A